MLLCCNYCLAQEIKIIEYNNEPILTVSYDSAKVNIGGAELITIKLLLEYEKECYNDSTYVEYWQYQEQQSYTDSTGLSWNHCVYIPPIKIKEWQHKEPTFKDFLVWIRKKYNLPTKK